jgi:pyrroloquinoline quinone biosynthesis protein B
MEPPRRLALFLLLLLPALVPLLAAAPGSAPPGPRIVVLGTAQDGGLPQTACDCAHCAAARRDPSRVRHVASLALHVPATGHVYLIDATPDLPAQIEIIHRFRPHPAGKTDRAPVDGILLTHAHMGHYLGLAHLGFESLSTKEIPTWASPRMAAFLRADGPWSQLVKLGNLALREIAPGTPFTLEPGLTVEAFPVPHRDEYSDTLAYIVRGPHRAVLYVPDTDTWQTWARPLPDLLREKKIDVALLDGTFYSPDELPDRDVTRIRHPLITATMDLLEPQVKAGKVQVEFIHLNHSNPAGDPGGPAQKAIEARGFRVARDGEEIGL